MPGLCNIIYNLHTCARWPAHCLLHICTQCHIMHLYCAIQSKLIMVKWIVPRWPDLVYDILSILIMWLLFQMIHFRFGQKRRMSLNRKMILTLKHWRRTSISWITQTEMKEGLFLKMVMYISLICLPQPWQGKALASHYGTLLPWTIFWFWHVLCLIL